MDQGGAGLDRPGTLEGSNDERARCYPELHDPLSDLIIRFVLLRQAVPAKPSKVFSESQHHDPLMMPATGEARGAAGLHLSSQPGTVEKRQKDF